MITRQTPFDELAELVKNRTNDDDPVFEVFWEELPYVSSPDTSYRADLMPRYVRRSRAESSSLLWATLKQGMLVNDWVLVPGGEGWQIWKIEDFRPSPPPEFPPIIVAEGDTPEDALCAAELARLKRGQKP